MYTLRGVSAGYGDAPVLRDIDLVVPAASVVALLGPNGAGKTTLLRVASGLLRSQAGEVTFDGQRVTGWTPQRLAQAGICLIPEGRGVFRSLTVRENLVLQADHDAEEAGIARAVDAFPRLGERLHQRAGTLSGGEQQMLALARAYVSKPRLVLLDEVSMGLAPRIVDEIFDFIRRLAAEGTALLLVEQYVSRALAQSDYVYLLNRGRIDFVGEPFELADEEVFSRYLGTAVS
jgi:branched-chain amino acid transport system ATP-binding protein